MGLDNMATAEAFKPKGPPPPLMNIPDGQTERVRATWTDGDFGRIAPGYERGAAEFIARLRLGYGERVLDVACGTGNLALPAARAGAAVCAIDLAPNLLSQLEERASAEDLLIDVAEGNAEALPYPDERFATVVSMFGAMFAARPERVAAELLRVTRQGGRIAMANWAPTGFVGQMLKATSTYMPPPPGVPSPMLWGDESTVRQRLARASDMRLTRRMMSFEYPLPPEGVVDLFQRWYGPMKRAFAVLQPEMQRALRADLVELWSDNNRATDGTTRVESEYLEVIAVKE
jgi:SAM-dependent methyltransferase